MRNQPATIKHILLAAATLAAVFWSTTAAYADGVIPLTPEEQAQVLKAPQHRLEKRLDRCNRRHCRKDARTRYAKTAAWLTRPYAWTTWPGFQRFNPCETITWTIDQTPGPATYDTIVWALDQVSSSTGLTFTPTANEAMLHFRWAPTTAAENAAEASVWPGNYWASGATVTIRPGLTPTRPLLLHELGHVAGLGHVDDPRSVMYHWPTVETFSPAEKAGLSERGIGGGCST